MKVAVYTITKNEEKFIERWAESCKEADYRLVIDTGSSDNTIHVAELAGCHTASIAISPWRFDDARNASLALIPSDIDYCIALDADEVLTPGWREALEKIDSGVTRPRYKYVWSWNPDGSEGLVYSGDKIHARSGYRWTHPVHEVLTPTITEIQGWVDLEIHHHPDPTKSRSQYLPLLELAVQEHPDDDRNRFYLGRELMFNGRVEEAKVHFERHLELSTWAPERATCMRYLGRVTGDREKWILRACGEAPYRREPWVDLAQFYYEKNEWQSCLFAITRALSITEKPLEYLCEAEAWGSLPYDLASIAFWNTGQKAEAIKVAQEALRLDSTNARIKDNLDFMYKGNRTSNVFAIIPTKSNFDGLARVVGQLMDDSGVEVICLIAHGEEAFKYIRTTFADALGNKLKVITADLDMGIHHMWNMGLERWREAGFTSHCFFVNDDVSLGESAASGLAGFLDTHPEFGIVCPNYDGRPISNVVEVHDTCRGRYNGSGGLAGFAMMLSSSLSKEWKFDETMMWWYGDDDVLQWTLNKGKKAGIVSCATVSENASWTLNNDGPKGLGEMVRNDEMIFNRKWRTNAR